MAKDEAYGVGDLVVLFLRPEIVPSGKLNVSLKRLVMAPPPWVKDFPYHDHPKSEVAAILMVQQDNPKRTFPVQCSHLLGVHRCLGLVPPDVNLIDKISENCEASHG